VVVVEEVEDEAGLGIEVEGVEEVLTMLLLLLLGTRTLARVVLADLLLAPAEQVDSFSSAHGLRSLDAASHTKSVQPARKQAIDLASDIPHRFQSLCVR
jgi:hypothetical protein